MKIAMLTNNYKPFIGGVPISVERLAEGLRSLGHQVTVFAPEGAGWEEEPDVVRFRVLYEWRDKGLVIGNFFLQQINNFFFGNVGEIKSIFFNDLFRSMFICHMQPCSLQ